MSIKIKSRKDILNDVVKDSKKYPEGWKAVFGKDHNNLSSDYYIFNSKTGIYLLKEYQKNPFEVRGIGGKIARHVDEFIDNEISKYATDFGLVQGNIKKISVNIQKGVPLQKIFNAAIEGKDMGITIPMKGHASISKNSFENIRNTFSTKQKRIDTKFKKIASDDGLYDSYR